MRRKPTIPAIYKLLALVLLVSLGVSIVQVRRSSGFRPQGAALSAPTFVARSTPGEITPQPAPGEPPGSPPGPGNPPANSNPGASDAVPQQAGSGPEVIVADGPSLSPSLRSMVLSAPLPAEVPEEESNEENRILPPKFQRPVKDFTFDSSIVQSARGSAAPMPSASANFEGVNSNGNYPPDTEGDIGFDAGSGKKYYVQWVNVRFQVWDVTNPASPSSVLGPSYLNTMWTGTGFFCQTQNGGDPLVLFDHLANRWLVSQLAYDFGSPSIPYGPFNFHQCVAVSTSADPTGTWNRYDYTWASGSTAKFNDYPKFAVWPDGYYLSVNQFNETTLSESWAGAGVAVLDRAAMIAGTTATMQRFDVGSKNLNFGSMLPSELDGPVPASGTPNYFTEWDDSQWIPPYSGSDKLSMWQFHVDWGTPDNSTFGLNSNFDPNQVVATSNVDPNLCSLGPCIKQPGTVRVLDTLADRLMHRMQYRNFGSYQTLVGNHSVDATSTDVAGIHWFELRNSGAGWSIYQEGVYHPDSDSRWMGSVALDQNGDMALGYSVSSSTTYPSVRYAGRLVGDTLGTLPQSEVSLIAGSGVQTGTAQRWGDYSMLGVDPVDDCTFWYTQEYYQTTSLTGWQTRIGSFAFPTCAPTVSHFQPLGGTTVCQTPDIGVDLRVTALMRQVNGSFNPSTVSLKLDAADVTSSATIAEAMVSPSAHVTILYKPPANLALGSHQVEFTYPATGGPNNSLQWSFTAAGIACP